MIKYELIKINIKEMLHQYASPFIYTTSYKSFNSIYFNANIQTNIHNLTLQPNNKRLLTPESRSVMAI